MKHRIFAFILCAFVALCGCQSVLPVADTTAPHTTTGAPPGTTASPTTAPQATTEATTQPEPISIRITAVGDILLHNTVSLSCKAEDGSFDFSPLFDNVRPLISGSDIGFVNQEVMLTGEVKNYPRFAAPAEVADALIGAGFNVVNLATNHTMDQGESGLEACLDNIHERNFDAVLGAFRTEEEANAPILLEKQGITFGFLSYTYGLNGLPAPGDSWKVNNLSETDNQANIRRITADMEAIRPLCDYLIVSMHWGAEYTHSPTSTQLSQAQLLCDLGADLIIGHHPHVLQPLEWLESKSGHQTLCMYSLGNFVSNQQRYSTMLGGLLEVNLTFDPVTRQLASTDAGVIPLVTHYADKKYTTYPLADYNDVLATAHGIERTGQSFSKAYLDDLARTVLGDALITQ